MLRVIGVDDELVTDPQTLVLPLLTLLIEGVARPVAVWHRPHPGCLIYHACGVMIE